MIGSMASTLVGINVLAWCMVILRPKLYGTKLYKPMLLNIKLSIAPIVVLSATFMAFVLLQGLYETIAQNAFVWWASLLVAAAGLVVWVLLLPNAGYLITELNFNHRDHDKTEVSLWYDIIGVLTLAMSGVMNMCFNVFLVQFIFSLLMANVAQVSFLASWAAWIVTGLLMLLASFGIYLGRYIRFNSWDLKHPLKFMRKLRDHYKTAGSLKNCALFILFHTLFFIVFYRATFGIMLEELIPALPLA